MIVFHPMLLPTFQELDEVNTFEMIQNELVNPDNTYTAIYYRADGGTTTSTRHSVTLFKTSKKIKVGGDRGIVVFASDEGRPRIRWLTSDTLQIERYPHNLDLSKNSSEDGAVHILYVEPGEEKSNITGMD